MALKAFKFIVPGVPVAQERRVVTKDGRVYDPPKSKAAKQAIGLLAKVALREHGAKGAFKKEPVNVKLAFHGANPLADLDNLIKNVLDGCNKILWADDRQICELYAEKNRDGNRPQSTVIEVVYDEA